MNPQTLFKVANSIALASWVLLVFIPNWKPTQLLVRSKFVPAILSLGYLLIVLAHFEFDPNAFSTLENVGALFQDPYLLLAGWVHYLAFDLLIGIWEVDDSQKIGLSHLPVGLCLAFTFLLGPIGFLLYLGARSIFHVSQRSS